MTDFIENKKIPGFGWVTRPVFQLGEKNLAIPMSLHRQNRIKLVDQMRKRNVHTGVALIRGGDEQCYYDSDSEMLFKQDSWFNYLFGVMEPGA